MKFKYGDNPTDGKKLHICEILSECCQSFQEIQQKLLMLNIYLLKNLTNTFTRISLFMMIIINHFKEWPEIHNLNCLMWIEFVKKN